MKESFEKKWRETVSVASVSFLRRQVRQRFQGWKALPSMCARTMQRPAFQYRIALLLAGLLALLLTWSLVLSTSTHLVLASMGSTL